MERAACGSPFLVDGVLSRYVRGSAAGALRRRCYLAIYDSSTYDSSTFEQIQLAWFPVPLVGVGWRIFLLGNVGPYISELSVELDKHLLPLGELILGENRFGRTFRLA